MPFANSPQFDEMLVEYLALREQGREPEIRTYLERLAPEEQSEFTGLVETAAWAEKQFPVTVRAHTLIGGRYELLEEIERGGMGKVWVARDTELDREVAVKVMSLVTQSRVETSVFFERERKALASIKHPGVVTIHEAGEEDDLFYIVMDLIEGTGINRVVDELAATTGERVPNTAELDGAIGRPARAGTERLIDKDSYFRSVAKIIAAVLRTLEAAHESGIVHRDIKPSNVMLLAGGRPMLLDFGLASVKDQSSGILTERLIGTANYLAPEQINQGRSGSDSRTDVYQVGLLLYELLTLTPAFPRNEVTDLGPIQRGEITLPRQRQKQIPRELSDVCLKAIEVNIDKRYQSAKEFREELEAWLEGRVPKAAQIGTGARVLRGATYFVRKHRQASAIAAAILLTASVFVVREALAGAPPPEVRVKSVNIRSGSGIVATLESDRRGATAGMFVFESGKNGKTYVVPAQLGEDTYDVSHDSGDFEITARSPTRAGLAFLSEARNPKLTLYSAATEEKLAALTLALDKMKAALDGDREDIPGIPAEDLGTYVDTANFATRSGGPKQRAIEFEADQLLGKKGWTVPDARATDISLASKKANK